MSNPVNPFQTRSVLRFPPGAQTQLIDIQLVGFIIFLSTHYLRQTIDLSLNIQTFFRQTTE